MSALVTAIWTGPFPAQVGWPPRTLQPGDEADVTLADLESTHWTRKQPEKRPAVNAKSDTGGDS